jgi:uncharacterized protein YdaU (DUF1376 family)
MSKAPAMPMYWDAYISDTTHLTAEEHGAYLLLLGAMWRRDGSVPDCDRDIARIVGLTLSKWVKVRARLDGFLVIESGTISQKNLQKIWKKTQEIIDKNRQNGGKGGRPKSNEIKDEAKADGLFLLNPNETIPEPYPNIDNNTSVLSSMPISENAPPSKPPDKPKSVRGTRLPQDWTPSQADVDHARAKGLQENEIENESAKFRDYWISKAGQSAVKLDWAATWRNWIASYLERRPRQAGRSNTTGYRSEPVSRADIAIQNYEDAQVVRFGR